MDGINALIAGVGRPQAEAFDYTTAKKNALLIQGGELELQNKQRDWELRPFKDEMAALSYLTDVTPMVQYEDVPELRQRLIGMGINKSILPDIPFFEQEAQKYGVAPKDYFNVWKNNAMTGLQRQALRVKLAGKDWGPRTKEEAIEVRRAGQKPEARSNIAKMIEERDSLPEGDPNRSIFDAAITKATQTKDQNLSVTMDKDGNIQITSGTGVAPGGPTGMTKPTQTAIEKELFSATKALSRLQGIQEAVAKVPDMQTFSTKLKQEGISWKSYFNMEVSPEEKEARENYVTARSRAFDNLNEYLSEKSGAAVTEQEFNRLKRRMPNPGTGLISDRGDDPIEFNRKMRDVIETLKMAAARYRYLLSTGLTESQVMGSIKSGSIQSIGAFKAAINGRAQELTEELKEAGVDPRDIPNQVKIKLRQEFKLDG